MGGTLANFERTLFDSVCTVRPLLVRKNTYVYAFFFWKFVKFGIEMVSKSLLLPPRGKMWSRRVPGVISGSIYALKVYL